MRKDPVVKSGNDCIYICYLLISSSYLYYHITYNQQRQVDESNKLMLVRFDLAHL
jgi:hypothetical protein